MRAHRTAFAAVAVSICLASAACGVSSIDPTEASFDVEVRNDLTKSVTLHQCLDGRCHNLGDPQPLAPGQVVTVGAAADATNWYVVRSGQVKLGCLGLRFSAKPRVTPIVRVSQVGRCM